MPLETTDVIINYLSTTTTRTGLRVRASLIEKVYDKGIRIDDETMAMLNIEKDNTLPRWNYTIRPQTPHLDDNMTLIDQMC